MRAVRALASMYGLTLAALLLLIVGLIGLVVHGLIRMRSPLS